MNFNGFTGNIFTFFIKKAFIFYYLFVKLPPYYSAFIDFI